MTDTNCRDEDDSFPWRVVAVDFGTFALVGILVLFLELFGTPTRRGFFCDDETISYPYLPNTVSEGSIVLIGILLPLVVIAPTQFWTYRSISKRVRLGKFRLPEWVKSSAVTWGSYMVGLGSSQIITCVGKFTIGRLRPHFLAVCRPDITCNGTKFEYLTQYSCLGNPSEVVEARLSFPSGHASVSFFTCVYLVVFLQSSVKWKMFTYAPIRGMIQFILIVSAWWVSLTRVMDNWHHWSDVLVGAVIGVLAAYVTTKYMPGIDKTPENTTEDSFLPLNTSLIPPNTSPV